MAKPRSPLEKPKAKAKLINLVLDGMTDAQAGAIMGTTRQAITGFRHRHVAEFQAARSSLEARLVEAKIASKAARILDADADYNRLGDLINARAADPRYTEPGYSTGMLVRDVKSIGTGKDAYEVDVYKADTAVLAERRAIRREVAEELGQITKPEPVVIDNRVQILVRQVDGFDPLSLG